MHTPTPQVTIGMPVYNAENYIEEAIDSILGQTFHDFELIITDNASTDRTQALCERYAQADSRVRYHRNAENIGANRNFNFVFTLARGKYFKWAAHDDFISPTYIEKCVQLLESDPSIILAHSETNLIDLQGNQLTVPVNGSNYVHDNHGRLIFVGRDSHDRKLSSPHAYERFRAILSTGWCYEVFGLIRSDALRRTSLLRSFYGADKVLLAELAVMGRFAIIPEMLFHNRRHPEQSRSQSVEERVKWTNTATNQSSLTRNLEKASAFLCAPFNGRMSFLERMKCFMLAFHYNTVKLVYEFGMVKEKNILR